MAEYAMREQAYGNTMAGQLKAFLENVALGDDHLKDMAMARTEAIFEAGNFNIEAVMGMLNIPKKLRFSANLPRIMAERLGPLLIKEAEIEGHMDVHASTSEETHVKSDTAVDAEMKAGWGPVSAKVKVHSQIGVESSRKRASDYSAGVRWRIVLEQAPPAETLMKIVDSLCRFFDKVTDMNESMADAEAAVLRQQAHAALASADDEDGETDDSDDSEEI